LIHDGNAGGGHYYSYNRNIENDTWTKFNDIQVVEEKEEVVMKEAVGGYQNISAYCLVYHSDENVQAELKARKEVANEIQQDNEIRFEKSNYCRYLSGRSIIEVEADNVAFQEEIEEYKFNSYVKNIVDTYRKRYDAVVDHLKNKKDNKSPPLQLNSFACFLKTDPINEGLFKWYILDCTLIDSEKKIGLRQLNPRLISILEGRIKSLNKQYQITKFTLTPQDETKLQNALKEYAKEFSAIIYSNILLNSSLNDKWHDIAFSLKKLINVLFFLFF
jgi:hypothetical protein